MGRHGADEPDAVATLYVDHNQQAVAVGMSDSTTPVLLRQPSPAGGDHDRLVGNLRLIGFDTRLADRMLFCQGIVALQAQTGPTGLDSLPIRC